MTEPTELAENSPTSNPGRAQRTYAWLTRPKLWDDVFTRTVSNILSVAIIAAFAALVGVISINRQAWAIIAAVAGAVVLGFVGFWLESRWSNVDLSEKKLKRRRIAVSALSAALTALIYILVTGKLSLGGGAGEP